MRPACTTRKFSSGAGERPVHPPGGRIAGVRNVENLLHTRGTSAPASRPKLERESSRRR
jgi:hypothetical protein